MNDDHDKHAIHPKPGDPVEIHRDDGTVQKAQVAGKKSKEELMAEETAKQILETQGRPKGILFSVHGEVMVWEFLVRPQGGEEYFEERQRGLTAVEYVDPELTAEEHEAMGAIFTAIQQIEEMPQRDLPLTRGEVIKNCHLTKKMISRLEKKEVIAEKLVGTRVGAATSKIKGPSHAIIYPTPLGRAYITEHFDPVYYVLMEKTDDDNGQQDEAGTGSNGQAPSGPKGGDAPTDSGPVQ